jgi:hypothetical protein
LAFILNQLNKLNKHNELNKLTTMNVQADIIDSEEVVMEPAKGWGQRWFEFSRYNPTVVGGAAVLVAMTLLAVLAPYIAVDPIEINPIEPRHSNICSAPTIWGATSSAAPCTAVVFH